jgi:hypothetical protein
MIVLVIGVVVVVAVVVALVVLRRSPRHDSGVTRFQRHIGALSPEARRAVLDRATPPPDSRREQRGN